MFDVLLFLMAAQNSKFTVLLMKPDRLPHIAMLVLQLLDLF